MQKKQYGIEKQGKLIAVIDYSTKEKVFSRVLTKKATKLFEETGYLPEGVKVIKKYPTVETFSTEQEAKQFIASGCKKKVDKQYGIFKSRAQYQLAKKLTGGNK